METNKLENIGELVLSRLSRLSRALKLEIKKPYGGSCTRDYARRPFIPRKIGSTVFALVIIL